MQTLFLVYAPADGDAPIRAEIACPLGDRRNLPWWQPEMSTLFSEAENPTHEQVRQAYDAVGEGFRRDLYVTRKELRLPDR